MRRVVVLIAVFVLVMSACANGAPDAGPATGLGRTSEPPTTASGRWVSVPPGPLSPRAAAIGVWTGAEVLVIGGEPEAWCPPGADCTPPEFTALVDGAAYDPATESWRDIADAPMPLSGYTSPVVVDDAVYLLAHGAFSRPGAEDGFLRYLVTEDRWERLPSPAR